MKEPKINTHDLGQWAFLRPGWWILHVVSIITAAFFGYYIIESMR